MQKTLEYTNWINFWTVEQMFWAGDESFAISGDIRTKRNRFKGRYWYWTGIFKFNLLNLTFRNLFLVTSCKKTVYEAHTNSPENFLGKLHIYIPKKTNNNHTPKRDAFLKSRFEKKFIFITGHSHNKNFSTANSIQSISPGEQPKSRQNTEVLTANVKLTGLGTRLDLNLSTTASTFPF